MNKFYFIAVIFASTLFLLFPGTVLSQQEERLAVVSEYEGDVKVEHESIKKTVTRIGNRIRNSAVYEDDSVLTMLNSTADLVFNDNTSLEIEEDTSLTISSREMSGEEKTEGGFIRKVSGKQSGIVRNIHVKAGKFLANITPSKSVLTEFETPTGVASVRGTVFTFAYIAGVTSIDLMQGLIDFADAGNDVNFSVEPGDNIDISLSELGHSSIGVNTGQIDVATETGTLIIESGESTHVDVDDDTGEVHVTADEGTVDFETSTGMAVIEEGEMAGTSVDVDTGEVTISSEEGAIEFETAMGNVMMEEGDAIGSRMDAETGDMVMTAEEGAIEFETAMGNVMMEEGDAMGSRMDAETGDMVMTAEVGTIEFETAMGNVMMEEGNAIGSRMDAETGDMVMTAEVGTIEFETAMGNVMMEEGDAMGSRIDADTGDMVMTAEVGTIMFETSGGTASIEKGEVVGTAYDNDTGEVTMTAMEGEVSFDTPMGTAVMQKGAVLEVAFDDNTGEISISSGGGSYKLETDNGTITMDKGGSVGFTVDHNTGEITVIGTAGDITMTNEDGATMTMEAGTSLGIMQDDGGHDGPMEPAGDDGGHDGPMEPAGDDGGHDRPESDGEVSFDTPVTGKDGVYNGRISTEDGQAVFDGTYTEATGVYEGTMVDGSGTYTGTYTEGNNTFAGTMTDSTGGVYAGTMTDTGFTGTYTDSGGNTYNFSDFQQSSFNADDTTTTTSSETSLPWVVDAASAKSIEWSSSRPNTLTESSFNNIGTLVSPSNPNTRTGDFEEHFGSAANVALIHTGFDGTLSDGYLEWEFDIDTEESRQFSFDYNFITDTTNVANDKFFATLIRPNGNRVTLASDDVMLNNFLSDPEPIDTPIKSGDTVFQTGWQTVSEYVYLQTGRHKLIFEVLDSEGSTDSAVLLDNIVDPPVVASSTDYLLTFARMLRGEVDIHDADLEADAVASAEHQAFIAKVNEVISDIENSSNSELVTGTDEFLDRLVVARSIIADHEDSTGFLQQTGVAHHLLEASIMTDRGIGTNIAAIKDSINQAKAFLVAHVNDFGETDALANIRTNINSVLANIDNMNNNEFTTATIVAIRDGLKQVFSDTIDHMNNNGCNNSEHPECDQLECDQHVL